MRPRDEEPVRTEFEKVIKEEERDVIRKPGVPDDVKAELDERFERADEPDPGHEYGG